MLKKAHRISNQRLIVKLSRQGQAYKTRWLVFKFLPALTPESKFALSIAKKAIPKAVHRNKLKRQIYESLRLHLPEIPRSIVCLIFIKKEIPQEREFGAIEAQIRQFTNSFPSHV